MLQEDCESGQMGFGFFLPKTKYRKNKRNKRGKWRKRMEMTGVNCKSDENHS